LASRENPAGFIEGAGPAPCGILSSDGQHAHMIGKRLIDVHVEGVKGGAERVSRPEEEIEPAFVHREAIDAMKEIGIDISAQCPTSGDTFAGQDFVYVTTVCNNV
jgi:protein-tyrosine-phosphatase